MAKFDFDRVQQTIDECPINIHLVGFDNSTGVYSFISEFPGAVLEYRRTREVIATERRQERKEIKIENFRERNQQMVNSGVIPQSFRRYKEFTLWSDLTSQKQRQIRDRFVIVEENEQFKIVGVKSDE